MVRCEEHMTKEKFTHAIDAGIKAQFEAVAETLPGNKYEIVEAMILAFTALPAELQLKLVSARSEDREPALAAIAVTRIRPPKAKSAG